ncbi:MAG: YCF48-related protein [Saprospiraceae bacterium]
MRHIASCIMLLVVALMPATLLAQWTTQTSGTTNTLQDVHFLNANYGVAVGDTGTVLLTTNGGINWQPLTIRNKNNIQSVQVIGVDTILVAAGTYFDGEVYLTTNGGTTWDSVANGIDLANAGDFYFTLNFKNILRSEDQGENWDTMDIQIGSTTLLERLYFPKGKVAYVMGNVSGFATYSAFGYRSDDDGQSWTSLFALDFPNNNAFTAAAFPSPDTGYIFTNRFERFLPGKLNQLIRVHSFYFDDAQTQQWRFAAEIVKDSMPTYMHDAQFLDNNLGYAVGENGHIYKTINGGADWTVEYPGNQPLKAIYMLSNSVGYAVGANGIIVKLNATTATDAPGVALPLQFYPNPTRNQIQLQGLETQDAILTIFSANGQIVQQTVLNGELKVSLNNLVNGWYTLQLQVRNDGQVYRGKLIVQQE